MGWRVHHTSGVLPTAVTFCRVHCQRHTQCAQVQLSSLWTPAAISDCALMCSEMDTTAHTANTHTARSLHPLLGNIITTTTIRLSNCVYIWGSFAMAKGGYPCAAGGIWTASAQHWCVCVCLTSTSAAALDGAAAAGAAGAALSSLTSCCSSFATSFTISFASSKWSCHQELALSLGGYWHPTQQCPQPAGLRLLYFHSGPE